MPPWYHKDNPEKEVSMLVQTLWIPEDRRTTLCIDSYQEGVLQGRFYGPDQEVQSFGSLSRFLIMMEHMLELRNTPQSDTTSRRFSAASPHMLPVFHPGRIPRGKAATFDLKILFRQHTSWQGTILWQEQGREQPFRSVLELILLLDSALREQSGKEAG